MNASCNQRDENGVVKVWLLHHNIPHQAVQTLSSLLAAILCLWTHHDIKIYQNPGRFIDVKVKVYKITKSISMHLDVAYNLHLYIDCFYLDVGCLSVCLSVWPAGCRLQSQP